MTGVHDGPRKRSPERDGSWLLVRSWSGNGSICLFGTRFVVSHGVWKIAQDWRGSGHIMVTSMGDFSLDFPQSLLFLVASLGSKRGSGAAQKDTSHWLSAGANNNSSFSLYRVLIFCRCRSYTYSILLTTFKPSHTYIITPPLHGQYIQNWRRQDRFPRARVGGHAPGRTGQ